MGHGEVGGGNNGKLDQWLVMENKWPGNESLKCCCSTTRLQYRHLDIAPG